MYNYFGSLDVVHLLLAVPVNGERQGVAPTDDRLRHLPASSGVKLTAAPDHKITAMSLRRAPSSLRSSVRRG